MKSEIVYPIPIAKVSEIRKKELNRNNIGLFFCCKYAGIICELNTRKDSEMLYVIFIHKL